MTGKTKILKCPVCDTVVEVLDSCGLELTCCGPEMVPLSEKIAIPTEPHAMIVERWGDEVKVRVGNVAHDMDDDHRIVWIEVAAGGQCCREFLSPGEPPEAVFSVSGEDLVARAYCSAHGLYRSVDSSKKAQWRYMEAGVTALVEA